MIGKRLPLFIFSIIFPIFLMTYQSIQGPFKPLFYASYPVNYFNEVFSDLILLIKKPFITLFAIRKENSNLQAEVQRLRIREQLYEEALSENRRLQSLVDLKPSLNNYVTSARIIARNPDKWSHILILDKGLSDGVKKDMAVRTSGGLVGKVISSERNHSGLLLLTDINSSVAVRLQKSRIEGVLSGAGSFKCNLKYIPNDIDVTEGEKLVTSGLDSLFPPGIPVGIISSVKKSQTSLFQVIQVEPFINPLKIEEALVVGRY